MSVSEMEKARLIELLKDIENHPEKTCPRYDIEGCFGCQYDKGQKCDMEARKADYLLANGVIVPPCKVGDVVYATKGCFYLPHATQIKSDVIITCEIIAIKETKNGKFLLLKPLIEEAFNARSANDWFSFLAIGKTVFPTREEALSKLQASCKQVEGEAI